MAYNLDEINKLIKKEKDSLLHWKKVFYSYLSVFYPIKMAIFFHPTLQYYKLLSLLKSEFRVIVSHLWAI